MRNLKFCLHGPNASSKIRVVASILGFLMSQSVAAQTTTTTITNPQTGQQYTVTQNKKDGTTDVTRVQTLDPQVLDYCQELGELASMFSDTMHKYNAGKAWQSRNMIGSYYADGTPISAFDQTYALNVVYNHPELSPPNVGVEVRLHCVGTIEDAFYGTDYTNEH